MKKQTKSKTKDVSHLVAPAFPTQWDDSSNSTMKVDEGLTRHQYVASLILAQLAGSTQYLTSFWNDDAIVDTAYDLAEKLLNKFK